MLRKGVTSSAVVKVVGSRRSQAAQLSKVSYRDVYLR